MEGDCESSERAEVPRSTHMKEPGEDWEYREM